jgi:hypothetical protein
MILLSVRLTAMKYRKLRIAFSAVCGVLCLLLVVLWMRSYSRLDWLQVGESSVASTSGRLLANELFAMGGPPSSSRTMTQTEWTEKLSRHTFANNRVVIWRTSHGALIPMGVGNSIPYWPLVVVALTLLVIPWLPWRFSLRTLLIATTLVTVGLGLIIYAAG